VSDKLGHTRTAHDAHINMEVIGATMGESLTTVVFECRVVSRFHRDHVIATMVRYLDDPFTPKELDGNLFSCVEITTPKRFVFLWRLALNAGNQQSICLAVSNLSLNGDR
jgi:hypothetical protein